MNNHEEFAKLFCMGIKFQKRLEIKFKSLFQLPRIYHKSSSRWVEKLFLTTQKEVNKIFMGKWLRSISIAIISQIPPSLPITKLFNIGTLNLSIDDLKYDDEIYISFTSSSHWKLKESWKADGEIFNSIFSLEHDHKLSIHTFFSLLSTFINI